MPENLKLLHSIYAKIYEDIKGKDEVIAIYEFINSAINNYGEDKVWSGIYKLYSLFKWIKRNDCWRWSFGIKYISNYEKFQLEMNNRKERYKKFEKILKEKLMKEFSTKEKLNKKYLKRILNNLDFKKI